MGSDREEFFKKRRGQKKKKEEDIVERAPYRYLIVTEGIETETNYFEGISRIISSKYNNTVNVKKRIELRIEGTGKNTNSLVASVEDFLTDIDKFVNRSNTIYGNIWLIFDKDDFSDNQFNSAIYQAEARGYNVGWSNESFELWFVLHFEQLVSGIGREQYNEKLTKYFKDKNIFSKYKIEEEKYNKNIDMIFEILCDYGDIDKAVKRAEKLMKDWESSGAITPSKAKPATTVFKLVAELSKFFK